MNYKKTNNNINYIFSFFIRITEICLNEIRMCHVFVCLLGERYGGKAEKCLGMFLIVCFFWYVYYLLYYVDLLLVLNNNITVI